jgi:DnaJ domain
MNYYDILGLSDTSEPEVIEAAYRALMKKYHPDKWVGRSTEAERRTKLINEAYAALRDPRRRREYDKKNGSQPCRPTASPHKQQTQNRSARPRPAAQPSMQPRRANMPPGAASAFSFSFGRSEVIGATIVFIGVLALGGIASRSSPQAQLAGTQTLLLPPASGSVLGPGQRQVFCITNKTLHPVEYSVYWGDTKGQNYEINAGTSIVHYSRRSGSPVIEYTQTDEPIVGVPRKIIRARVTSENDRYCNPNYSFAYQDADISRWSQYDRFGLFRDDPVTAIPAASFPNAGTGVAAP